MKGTTKKKSGEKNEANIATILLPLGTSLEKMNPHDEFVRKTTIRKRLRNIKDTFIYE